MSEVRYCFVGDSLMAGSGDMGYRGWVGRLFDSTVHPYRTFYNLGIRSDTSEDIRARWEPECSARLPPPFDGRVAIGFGTNDSAKTNGKKLRVDVDESIANAREIFGKIRNRGWAPIWIGPMPIAAERVTYIAHHGLQYHFDVRRIAQFDRAYKNEAEVLGVPYVGLFEKLRVVNEFLESLKKADGLHPSEKGYKIVTKILQTDPVMQSWMN